MKNEDVEVRIVADGVGDISENDVTMSITSKAIVIGFQVRIPAAVKSLADREKVPVSLYSVVYELFDSVRSVLADLMPIITVEKEIGSLKVLARFRDNKKNVVLGGVVEEGIFTPKHLVRALRGKEVIAEGKLIEIRQGRDVAKSIKTGSECGLEMQLGEGHENVAVNDRIILYVTEEQKKALGL